MQAEKNRVLSLAIPFFNEEENALQCIKDHVHALSKAGMRFEIIAVDNASVDKTGEILDKLKSGKVKVVHLRKNAGYGGGIMHGWLHASGTHLGFTCGDNEMRPEAVIRVFRKLAAENLQLCKGKRVSRGYSFFRKLESLVYNKIFCPIVLGYRLGDINGFPKVISRECFNALHLRYKDSFFDTEMMVKAVRNGYRIGDVPVEYEKRQKGKSSVKFYIALEFLKNLVKFRKDILLGKT